MEKILAIYYSQTGQLQRIIENFLKPFQEKKFDIQLLRIEPADPKPFEFPWTSKRFFGAMPATVLENAIELKKLDFKHTTYDLVIFAYQPWFLSPSIPATSILKEKNFQAIIKNTPVVTLIGSRNMWLSAQEKVKRQLNICGANLAGNIALTDKNHNLTSAITIIYWMFWGNKKRLFGIFPEPGIAESDIRQARKFGEKVMEKLSLKKWDDLQKDLIAMKAAEVDADLMFIERRAAKIFSIWAKFISKRKHQQVWLEFFKIYLITALFFVAPPVLLINKIFFGPFFRKEILRNKNYYSGVTLMPANA